VGKGYRISYFDVVGKATAGLAERDIGAAITRLSAAYRSGGDAFDHSSAEGRAAYLWHHLPAHVCDLARLIDDAGSLLGRTQLRLLGLGAGPGTEVLAVLEAASAAKARGQLEELERIEALRVDRSGAWDSSFQALLEALLPQIAGRKAGFGQTWQLEAPAESIVCDLGAAPLPDAVLDAARQADLVIAANLLTELAPRGGDELPAASAENLRALLATLAGRPAEVLLVDRAGAPGAVARLAAVAELAREVLPGVAVTGPRERATRCGCTFTRQGKAIYRHVRLPTTRDEDRPVRNCKTLWYRLRVEE
jgi:hypothetical protein